MAAAIGSFAKYHRILFDVYFFIRVDLVKCWCLFKLKMADFHCDLFLDWISIPFYLSKWDIHGALFDVHLKWWLTHNAKPKGTRKEKQSKAQNGQIKIWEIIKHRKRRDENHWRLNERLQHIMWTQFVPRQARIDWIYHVWLLLLLLLLYLLMYLIHTSCVKCTYVFSKSHYQNNDIT